LKVDNFRSHNNKKIKVNLWKEIEPPINYNIQISNIAFINGSLLIIAESESSEQELSIYALQLNLSNDKITLVNSWVNQSLQELIYNSETDNIEIVLSTNDGRRTNETINIH